MKNSNLIRMRNNNNGDGCSICGADEKHSLQIFDIKIGDIKLHICDECNEVLMVKTLRATTSLNARLKSKKDLAVLHERSIKSERERELSGNKRLIQ